MPAENTGKGEVSGHGQNKVYWPSRPSRPVLREDVKLGGSEIRGKDATGFVELQSEFVVKLAYLWGGLEGIGRGVHHYFDDFPDAPLLILIVHGDAWAILNFKLLVCLLAQN